MQIGVLSRQIATYYLQSLRATIVRIISIGAPAMNCGLRSPLKSLIRPLTAHQHPCCFSSTSKDVLVQKLPARWLSEVKSRIGKCIIFGLQPAQVDEAASILRTVVQEWRELVAGSEGFLVRKGRSGLERHNVVWGEMVCASRVTAQLI